MKLLWTLTMTIFILFLSLALQIQPGALAEEEMMKEEGIIDIDYPDAHEVKVEINITGNLFALAAKAVEDESDPSLSNFLAGLKALYVRVYETELLMGHTPRTIVKFYEQQLLKKKWEVLARIKENGNMTGVYTLTQDDIVKGLFVVISNQQEDTVVVNLAGTVDLAKLSALDNIADDIAGVDLNLSDLGQEIKKKYHRKSKPKLKNTEKER
jgi:hypothetical protein